MTAGEVRDEAVASSGSNGKRVEILEGDYRGQRGVAVATIFVCDRHKRKHGCTLLYDVQLGNGVVCRWVEARPLADDEPDGADETRQQATLW